ncbi:MAG TPA: rod shape-determining protein MreC [Atribacteraceae bacterium]|nr:rod shape-determining protein MreC [Atribacteraceae bacterium]
MRNKLIVLTVIIVIAIQLVLFTVRGGEPAHVFGALRQVTVPFSRGWRVVERGLQGWKDFFTSKNQLLIENRGLINELGQLQNENSLLVERIRELSMMMEAALIEKKIPFEVIPAQVIARDPYDWLGKIIVDRGIRDGIRSGLTVVTYQGMVGRIEDVYDSYSVVRLILSPKLATGAVIQRTRDIGVVVGDGGGLCSMNYIYRTSEVEVDDLVVTSGLGISTPRGIVIGRVREVKDIDGSLFKEVSIEPASDFSVLEYLFVIRSARGDD